MKKMLAIGLVVTVATVAFNGCGGSPRDEAIVDVQLYELIKALPRAQVKASKPEMVSFGGFSVGGEKRDVLFMHPVSRVEFPPVKVSSNSWMEFGLGINEEAWSKGGDGVTFSVSVLKNDKKAQRIFTRHLQPQTKPEDRRWIDVQVPLKAFAGQEISIVFETSPGPNRDTTYDWSGWSHPRVFIGK